jgi:hypothetical protein
MSREEPRATDGDTPRIPIGMSVPAEAGFRATEAPW